MGAMKTSVGRLYILFNACLPENEKVKKRLNICKLTESRDYNELKNYAPFTKYFDSLFSKDKLAGYDSEKLDEIIKVVPEIIPLIERIGNAINYGNAMELTEKDIPDLTSVKSINALAKKLKIDTATPNITNITKKEFMAIFSDKTIKDSAEALKYMSEADLKDPYEAVKQNLKDYMYCIRSDDIKAIQDNYANKIADIKSRLADIKSQKWKLRRKKWLIIGFAIVILTGINAFDLLSMNNLTLLNVLSAVLLILYFFMG